MKLAQAIPFRRLDDPVEMKKAAERLIDRAQRLLRERASILNDHRAVPCVCRDCATLFEFSAAEVQQYTAAGSKLPVRCRACRAEKRRIKQAYAEGKRWPSGWPKED